MDIMSLALAKKFALKVAAGFSDVEVDGMNIIFTLNDNTKVTLTVPTPANGISIVDVDIDSNKNLICTMSNGSVINAGQMPVVIPERGVDYWTQQDQQQIQTYIDNSISQAFYIEQDAEHDTLIFKRINN